MKKISPNSIKVLLDKYLEGKTSLEEERTLIEFFQSNDIPKELEQFKAEFQHYGISGAEEPGDIVQNAIDSLGIGPRFQPKFYASGWYRIAATILLIAVSFFIGYGVNIKSSLTDEVSSLKAQIVSLQETTISVMLQGQSSHQRIQALVMASEIPEVTDELLQKALRTLNEDQSPVVRSVALEFISLHRNADSVQSTLIASLLNQEYFSIQIELLHMIYGLNDLELNAQLEELLSSTKASSMLKKEIRKIIQNNTATII